ncbi:MAG: tetratricopeptide repeat protein, partial [Bacteroidota bacterium]
SIFVFALHAGTKAYLNSEGAQRKSVLVVFLGTLGFVVISFFDFPKERIEHTMLFGVFLGYLAYQGRSALKPGAIKTKPQDWFPVFVGLMAAALAFNLNLGLNRFNGERHVLAMLRAKKSSMADRMAEEARNANSYFYTLDPMVVPLSYYEGLEFYQQNDWENAAIHFFDAYAKNPYNFHVINNLATSLTQMKRYQEAVPYYLEALAINKYFDDCKFNLAYTYFQLGELTKAEQWASQTSDAERKQLFLSNIEAARSQRQGGQ